MKKEKTLYIIAISILLIFLAPNVYAIPLFSGQTNLLSDNSAEYLLNKNVDPTTGTVSYSTDDGDTFVNEGDRLRGWFQLETIEDQTGGGTTIDISSDLAYEITGFFDIEVLSKIDNGGNNYTFIMQPFAGFAGEIESLFGLGAGSAANSMVVFVEDIADDFTRLYGPTDVDDAPGNASEEALLASSSGGNLLWSFGVTEGNEFWVVNPLPGIGDDVSLFRNFTTGANAGTVNIALNNIVNNSPWLFGPVFEGSTGNFYDATGNGNLLGINDGTGPGSIVNTPADSFDDFNFVIRPTAIPEPGTMLLLGFGIIGLAGAMRRKTIR